MAKLTFVALCALSASAECATAASSPRSAHAECPEEISRASRNSSWLTRGPCRLSILVPPLELPIISSRLVAPSLPTLKLRGGARPASALVTARSVPSGKGELVADSGMIGGVDVGLLACFAGWYLGNYYYTLNNKYALKAAGGATGFPVTIGFAQFVIGSLYALFLWLAPDARALPATTMDDLMKIVPVAGCAAGAHLSSIFSMNLGAVSFAQIVKAAEPAFAALLGVTLYGKTVSKAKVHRLNVTRPPQRHAPCARRNVTRPAPAAPSHALRPPHRGHANVRREDLKLARRPLSLRSGSASSRSSVASASPRSRSSTSPWRRSSRHASPTSSPPSAPTRTRS